MSESIEQPKEGYGHTVEVTLPDGSKRQVPFGFTDPEKEAKAAKKLKIENPETAASEAAE